MKRDAAWWLRIAVPVVLVSALGVGLVGAGAFDGNGAGGDRRADRIGAPGISLVAFDGCASALEQLRGAALPLVGPYGLAGGAGYAIEDVAVVPKAAAGGVAAPERNAESSPTDAGAKQQPAPDHSSTNTHETGVDEPDIVKTDGKRLISIADGRLRVVDVASRTMTATVALPQSPATQLLISGDRALVVTAAPVSGGVRKGSPPIVDNPNPDPPIGDGFDAQSQLVLVDLTGAGKVLGTLSVEGGYLDARQVGSVARVVVRSGPRLRFVYPDGVRSPDEAILRNRDVVRGSSLSDWLPRYELEQNGSRSSGQLVECTAVTHPAHYTGASMLTVLTVDLVKELGVGDPVSIVADGDTVYGTGTSLYVADDHSLHGKPGGFAPPQGGRTEVYQFDISRPGKPDYVASGEVAGTLLNQYSLSEYAGRLRIATTASQPGPCCDQPGKAESAVTVLARNGDALAQVGRVGGLGVGERIYAVRFIGPVGYVVTFRQTDPLYTVDLSNPAQPKVAGELKITGFSAYLHPAGDSRLIGVGQEATEQGRRTGTQVSLFDTGNLAAARRVAQYQLPGGSSEVEFDPHAFLYWPEKGLLVLPINQQSQGEATQPASGALVLRLSGDSFTEVGMVSHPAGGTGYPDRSVRRALVIGDELWTVSGSGVLVSDLAKLGQRAWLPFT
ncbi:MAG: beta-propeller domain-containing protein [Labedaea sp.]